MEGVEVIGGLMLDVKVGELISVPNAVGAPVGEVETEGSVDAPTAMETAIKSVIAAKKPTAIVRLVLLRLMRSSTSAIAAKYEFISSSKT
jgi:hypothetical protein